MWTTCSKNSEIWLKLSDRDKDTSLKCDKSVSIPYHIVSQTPLNSNPLALPHVVPNCTPEIVYYEKIT